MAFSMSQGAAAAATVSAPLAARRCSLRGAAVAPARAGCRAARVAATRPQRRVRAEAAPDADAELEARLAAFKGTKNWKDVRAEREGGAAGGASGATATPAAPAAPVDWGTETVFFEGPPSRGDLAVNVLLGFTLLWLPLSLAAVGRAIWVNYKITDKRVSVSSTSPLNTEQLDASYAQMKEVRAIGRGVGLWGDMVIVLNDGAKIEIRCIDRWQEIKAYIEAQIAAAEMAKEAGYAARRAAKKA